MSNLVFFDTETVDVPENSSGDIIIQLAGVVKTNSELLTFNTLANPGQPITPGAMERHGIIPSKIAGLAPITSSGVFSGFCSMNQRDDLYFVCYNMGCDVEALKRVGLDISKKTIDLWRVVKLINDRLGLPWESTRLQFMMCANELYLRRHLEQETLQAHDALFDSYDLMILFEWMQEKFKMTVEQAYQITHNPILYSKIPFGKHKGHAFTYVTQGQLAWMYENVDDPDIKFTINQLNC